MALSPTVIKRLGIRAGIDVTTPAGATALAHDIEARTGERLTPNTIKRLVGILPYDGTPRKTTLDILGRYIGFRSWAQFERILKTGMSIFGNVYPFIPIRELPLGTLIHFKWEPDRTITLRKFEYNHFCEVVSVENSKLQVGDILHVQELAEGFPFYVREVRRGDEHLGSYATATETGISDLVVEKPSDSNPKN